MKTTEEKIAFLNSILERVRTLQYQDRQALDNIFTDARLFVRRVFGQESVWMHDLEHIRFAPEEAIYNREHHAMTGAWQDGASDLTRLINGMKKELSTFGLPASELPEITWEWLWRHLTWKLWAALVGVVTAAFVAGVTLGQTTFVRELLKISK